MAVRTLYSFTGDETFDTLVIAYISIRIIWCVGIFVTCLPQLIFEIKYQTKENLVNPRSMTLIGLICFSILRILYSAFLLHTNDDTTGSICDYLGMYSLFFEMWCWAFIGSYWCRLLFALFTVKPVYHQRVWVVTWSVIALYVVYEVIYSLLAAYAKDWAPTFFTAGFLFLLVLLGIVCFTGSFFLHRQIQFKKNLLTGKVAILISRIKVFSVLIIIILLVSLSRDILFYVILKIKLTDPITHLSNTFTMFFECSTATIMMIAVAECPINYITFETISPSLHSGKYGSSDSSSSRSRENTTTSSLSDNGTTPSNQNSAVTHSQKWQKKPRESTPHTYIQMGSLQSKSTSSIGNSHQQQPSSVTPNNTINITTSSSSIEIDITSSTTSLIPHLHHKDSVNCNNSNNNDHSINP